MKMIPALSILLLLAGILAGCSKEDMNKMVADVKKSAGDLKTSAEGAVDKAKEVAKSAGDLTAATDVTGKGSMKLDAQTEFAASYIRLVPMGSDGSGMLQIKSTKDDDQRTMPSFFIQGDVKASSLQELVGQPIPCRVFAQKTDLTDVWSNLTSEPILVSIQKDKNRFKATFDKGKLTSSFTQTTIDASGSFECVEF